MSRAVNVCAAMDLKHQRQGRHPGVSRGSGLTAAPLPGELTPPAPVAAEKPEQQPWAWEAPRTQPICRLPVQAKIGQERGQVSVQEGPS